MADIRPESEIDLFTDDALRDPYPLYQRLRDQAGVVWMRPTGMFAVSRCAEVRDVLRNWQVFSSARGTAMNEPINQAITGSTLASDRPLHDKLRGVLGRPLSLAAMRALAARIEVEAEGLVERLVARRRFDAATDLAQYLPVAVISFLVGLQGTDAGLGRRRFRHARPAESAVRQRDRYSAWPDRLCYEPRSEDPVTALVKRVERIDIHEIERGLNNTLRGISRLEVSVR